MAVEPAAATLQTKASPGFKGNLRTLTIRTVNGNCHDMFPQVLDFNQSTSLDGAAKYNLSRHRANKWGLTKIRVAKVAASLPLRESGSITCNFR